MKECKAKGMYGTACRGQSDVCILFKEYEEGEKSLRPVEFINRGCPEHIIKIVQGNRLNEIAEINRNILEQQRDLD